MDYKNKMKMRWVVMLLSVFLVASCAENKSQQIQDNALNLSQAPYKHFHQVKGNSYHPNEYFTCNCNKS